MRSGLEGGFGVSLRCLFQKLDFEALTSVSVLQQMESQVSSSRTGMRGRGDGPAG